MNTLRLLPALLLLIALAWLTPPTLAQERELRFLAWDEKIAARSIALVARKKHTPIPNLHPLQRTEPLKAQPVDGRLQLIALDHPQPETATFSVPLPAQAECLLVLLLPDPKAPCGLRGLALEDSPKSFPWGSFRLFNATDREVLMRMGKVVKALPSGFTPVDFTAPALGNHPVLIAPRDTPEQPFYSSIWTADPDSRRLIVLLPSTDTRLGHLTLKVIPEQRPPITEIPTPLSTGKPPQ